MHRFHNEAQAAASLIQANIVQIYEVGCMDGVHFIAQEYVKGQSLKQLLARSGSIEPAMAVNIMRQVAAALAALETASVSNWQLAPSAPRLCAPAALTARE